MMSEEKDFTLGYWVGFYSMVFAAFGLIGLLEVSEMLGDSILQLIPILLGVGNFGFWIFTERGGKLVLRFCKGMEMDEELEEI